MANPRQRRKARSSSYKPVSNPFCNKKRLKKTPAIRGPKVLQESWDKTKTVRQNYAALGLVQSLDPMASGGAETLEQNTASLAVQTATTSKIRSSFGRIVKDADGNVVGVELPEDSMGEVEQDMSCLVPEMDGVVERRWVTEMGGADGVQREVAGSSGVVQALELLGTASVSKDGVSNEARYAPTGERAYLRRLIARHGTDIAGMAKDRKLNWEQRTEGELRRGLRRSGLVPP